MMHVLPHLVIAVYVTEDPQFLQPRHLLDQRGELAILRAGLVSILLRVHLHPVLKDTEIVEHGRVSQEFKRVTAFARDVGAGRESEVAAGVPVTADEGAEEPSERVPAEFTSGLDAEQAALESVEPPARPAVLERQVL